LHPLSLDTRHLKHALLACRNDDRVHSIRISRRSYGSSVPCAWRFATRPDRYAYRRGGLGLVPDSPVVESQLPFRHDGHDGRTHRDTARSYSETVDASGHWGASASRSRCIVEPTRNVVVALPWKRLHGDRLRYVRSLCRGRAHRPTHVGRRGDRIGVHGRLVEKIGTRQRRGEKQTVRHRRRVSSYRWCVTHATANTFAIPYARREVRGQQRKPRAGFPRPSIARAAPRPLHRTRRRLLRRQIPSS